MVNDIETINCDLLDKKKLYALSEIENVIYMAGRKFGTDGSEWLTWAMNSSLPSFVAHNFAGCIRGIHEILHRQGLLKVDPLKELHRD